MDGQIVFNIVFGTMALIAFIITISHGMLMNKSIGNLHEADVQHVKSRGNSLDIMQRMGRVVERAVKDIHGLYEALKQTVVSMEDHNERIHTLEQEVEKLTKVVARLLTEQENMKITHL